MDIQEIITLIIAIWGAVLSTIVFIQGLIRNRRKLKISLVHEYDSEKLKIHIVNAGEKPVEIRMINVNPHIHTFKFRCRKQTQIGHIHYGEDIFETIPDLPKMLDSGNSCEYYLSNITAEKIFSNDMKVLITVFDSLSKKYKKHSVVTLDQRNGEIKPKQTKL